MSSKPYNIPSGTVQAKIEVKRSKFLVEVRNISTHEAKQLVNLSKLAQGSSEDKVTG